MAGRGRLVAENRKRVEGTSEAGDSAPPSQHANFLDAIKRFRGAVCLLSYVPRHGARRAIHGQDLGRAEQAVLAESTSVRVVRSKRMDVSDLGPSWADSNFWVVVVEWINPGRPDPLPQQDDPEGETETTFRRDHARGFGTR